MKHSVRLRRFDSGTSEWVTAYEFDAKPFVEPTIQFTFNSTEPPVRSGSRCRWEVTAKLYGSSAGAVADAWNELRAAIESTSSPAQGIQLLKDDVVIEEISPEGGYLTCMIESLSAPKSDPQWVANTTAVLVVTGWKPAATSIDGVVAGVEDYELSYAYDAGLLTKTLQGTITVVPGQSAEAAARTFGLELPSSNFQYVTRGPEGVDVTVLDEGDTKARFVSTIREAGDALPSGVGPDMSVNVETVTIDGVDSTTIVATAQGPGAVDAVKSARPAARFNETQSFEKFGRSARATYTTRVTSPTAPSVKRISFRITGGGRPVKWSPRTGGRSPSKHYGAFLPVTVAEEIVLEKIGTPGTDDFKCPQPVTGLEEDLSAFDMSTPMRVEIGKDRSSDKWQCSLRRGYTGPDYPSAFAAVIRSVFAPGDSSNIALEAQRRGKGVD